MVNKSQFTVWVGGSEIGTYSEEGEAIEVADEWHNEGYSDVEIDEWTSDELTPEEMNAELRQLGF